MPAPVTLPEDLSNVQAVEWRRGGGPTLRLADGLKTHVPLWNRDRSKDPDTALAAVRRLRREVPTDRQIDWPTGCERAFDLVRCPNPDRPLWPFERVQEQAMSPWLPAFGMLGGEAVGLILRLLTGQGRFLLVGPAFGLMLSLYCWLLNRHDHRRVITESPTQQRSFGEIAALFAAAATLYGQLCWGQQAFGWPDWTFWLAGLLIPAEFALIYRFDRETRGFREERRADAVTEWDALHADPQREPAWQAGLWSDAQAQSDPDAPKRPGRC